MGSCWGLFFCFSWPLCTDCGILVPRPGIEPASPAVKVQSCNHWTAREFPVLFCFLIKRYWRTSLVVQWLRIRLPMQETQVQSLVWEDHTCHGATKPVSHSYRAHMLQQLKLARLEPVLHNNRSHHKEKPSLDFPGGAVVKNPPANAGDTGSSPGPGRSYRLQSN